MPPSTGSIKTPEGASFTEEWMFLLRLSQLLSVPSFLQYLNLVTLPGMAEGTPVKESPSACAKIHNKEPWNSRSEDVLLLDGCRFLHTKLKWLWDKKLTALLSLFNTYYFGTDRFLQLDSHLSFTAHTALTDLVVSHTASKRGL